MKTTLTHTIAEFPTSPGVYKMCNKEGRVLYIGKAKNLRGRVRQYFQKNYQHSTRTRTLMEQVESIEPIVVDTELEALILETNLIKQYQPKYNILMKDDKNYVYIKITREDFPRIQIVRTIEKDNARYIGPKTAAHKVQETLKILKKIFPFRHCGLDIALQSDNSVKVTRKVIKYPCLDYFIKRCAAPCIANCTKEEYTQIISQVERFLEGKADQILTELTAQMMNAAKEHKFEKAAQIRDKIEKINAILEKQKVSDPNQEDKDIINYCIVHGNAYFNLFQIRDGILIGQENFILSAADLEESESEEVLDAFLQHYYTLATDIPKEILIPHEVAGSVQLTHMLTTQKGQKVHILTPQKGQKNKLLTMSLNNARIYADRNKPKWYQESVQHTDALKELQNLLALPALPRRIECYDISHLAGTETVGSMVVFENGVPKKSMYRKFYMRTIQGRPDDYKSLEEVLTRRLRRLAKQQAETHLTLKRENKKSETYLLCTKNKKEHARIEISKIKNSHTICMHLTLKEEKYLQPLLEKIRKKAHTSRIYLMTPEKYLTALMLQGWEELKKTTKSLPPLKKGSIWMLYNMHKHKPDESFEKTPDLIIIDGGKGQLSAAHKVLKTLKLTIPHIGIAKRFEHIILPNTSTPLILDRTHASLKLIQRARDEAHRFAITYNRACREKGMS